MLLALLRRLRHGPLAFLGPFWLRLGRGYRAVVRRLPFVSVRQRIGPYGPFRLGAELAFSDLENWGGAHNRGFAACIEACRGKHSVLDIGAHMGFVALPAASVLGPGGRLHAFEPARANLRSLRRHVRMNRLEDRIAIHEVLVGAETRDDVPFYESVGAHGQNAIVLKSETTLQSEEGGWRCTTHPQVALDDFCPARGLRPEVIKIDVEGAEIGVLQGARSVLMEHRPLIFLSIHPHEIGLAGGSLDELRALIDDLGYEICEIDGTPARELRLDEYLVRPRTTTG